MKTLSKSQYVRGLQCHKSLWLYRHRKDVKDPIDPFQQSIFHSGTEFGKMAMKRFAGGVLIEADHAHPEDALDQTKAAIASGASIIYEAAFLFDDVLVRADIVRFVTGGVELYEVKSSTKVEEVYFDDVAIQRHVIAGAGYPVVKAFVVHANPAYVRQGPLDLHRLFQIMDVTVPSEPELEAVPRALADMKKNADGAEAPAKSIGSHCSKPYDCDFTGHCWAHVPEYSVFNIPYAKMEKKLELFNRGVVRVDQVNPALAGITDKRSVRAIEAARLGKPAADRSAISAFLNGLQYPIAHLDFETDNPVIPPYDGLRPYSQMPFQASVRIQKEFGGPVTDHGFLGDGLTDPREGLTDFLLRTIPGSGTVLAYYKAFEAGRITELAQEPSARPLAAVVDRLEDLADPFSKGWYTHPGFLGKWSIKNVLPVLVPDMTYAGLEIKNGTEAMAAYAELRDPNLDPKRRAVLVDALKIYCGQDTMAMVRILEHLYAVADGKVTF